MADTEVISISSHTHKLSVGMPVCNGEPFIVEALKSVLSQSFDDFELIINDNGSTDRTEEIVRDYGASDSRIDYVRNPKNLGATANYNGVFQRSRGRYFKWASSNDICGPGFFESCVAVLDEHDDVALVCPMTRLFDADTGWSDDSDDNLHLDQNDSVERFIAVVERLGLNNMLNGVTRSSVMAETQLIPDIFAGDKNYIAEVVLRGKMLEVPERLFHRRIDAASATHMKNNTEVHLHFDPTGKKPMRMQVWKQFALFHRGVSRSTLPFAAKMKLHGYLLKQARWSRNKLAHDLLATIWEKSA